MPGRRNRRRGGRGGGRRRLPPLQRMYGWFHCQDCNRHWESSYVWCVRGTFKVYFKQECQNCSEAYNPYEVDYLLCPVCQEYECICEGDRHIDRRKQHRSDLCLKCRAGYPCQQIPCQQNDSDLDYLDSEPEDYDYYD